MPILNIPQAAAALHALRALDNAHGYAAVQFKDTHGELFGVSIQPSGAVTVERGAPVPAERERYPTVTDFVIIHQIDF